MSTDSRCPRNEAISAAIDDALSPSEATELDRHLDSCPVCGAAMARMSGARAVLRTMHEDGPGFDLSAAVLNRLPPRTAGRAARGARSGRTGVRRAIDWLHPGRGWLRLVVPSAAAASVALAVGIAAGSLLVGGLQIDAGVRQPTLAAFGASPPGSLCLGSGCGRFAR